MPPQREDPPTLLLAGKRVDGPVMRNEGEANRPRRAKGTRDITSFKDEVSAVAECPTQDRALLQRLRALENANLVRIDRADTKKRLKNGELDFDSFLDEPPESCREVPILTVLTWLPNIKRRTAQQIIGTLPVAVPESTPVALLPARAKYALSAKVEQRVQVYRRSVFAAAPAAAVA